MRRLFASLCLLLLITSSLFSQTTNEGTDFWFGFMENEANTTWPVFQELSITARQDANVLISTPSGQFNVEVSVAANSTQTVSIPQQFMPTVEGITETGLHITSDVDISVYALSQRNFSADATVVLPTHVLGQDYWVMAHMEPEGDGTGNNLESEIVVVATENGTQIEITPSAETFSGSVAGTPFTIELNQGETYQLKSNGDLTGTRVTVVGDASTCAPIAVFGGNKFTNVGGCGGNHDFLVEQMFPINTWGRDFIYVPLRTRNGGDYVKFMAAEDGTSVEISGISSAVQLNAGEWTVFKALPGVRDIKADKPIMVGQFSRSTQCDGIQAADPFMLILSPNQQRLNQISFNTLKTANVFDYYLTMITTREGVEDVRLDGEDISSEFSITNGNDFVYATLEVTEGAHNLVAPNGITAYAYGFGPNESYGFSTGVRVEDASLIMTANEQDLGTSPLTICPGTNIFFAALTPDLGIPQGFTSYAWDMGDGNFKSGRQIEHTYTEAGDYTVTLTGLRQENQCVLNDPVLIERTVRISDLDVGDIQGASSVCPFSESNYGVENNSEYTYAWRVEGGAITGSSNSQPDVTVSWGDTNANAFLAVVVTDSNGCQTEEILEVNINNALTPAIPTGPQDVCVSDTEEREYFIPHANMAVSYEWFVEGGTMVGVSSKVFVRVNWDNVGIGRIWYKQSDPNGTDCEGLSEVLEVTVYEALSVEVDLTFPSCFGSADGVATLNFTGGKPGTYQIRTATGYEDAAPLTGLRSGSYSIEVRDGSGCFLNVNFNMSEPPPLELGLELIDGNIIRSIVRGGTPGYEYSINGSEFQTSPDFLRNQGGETTVTVRDANGCTAQAIANFVITSNEPQVLDQDVKSFPNPARGQITISQVEAGDAITLVDLKGNILKEIAIQSTETNFTISTAQMTQDIILLRLYDKQGKAKLLQKVMIRE